MLHKQQNHHVFAGPPWVPPWAAQPPDALGMITFQMSASHWTTVTSYEVRLWDETGVTQIDSTNIGKPIPDQSGFIRVDVSSFMGGQADGAYTVSVAAIGTDGTADSQKSDVFYLPLS